MHALFSFVFVLYLVLDLSLELCVYWKMLGKFKKLGKEFQTYIIDFILDSFQADFYNVDDLN